MQLVFNRLSVVGARIISHSQSAFMPGRYILDGVVTQHETLHEINIRKTNAVILKLDYEKEYDKVKWPFLQQAL